LAQRQIQRFFEELAEAEKAARAAKRGMWADENPTAPWDWRRDKRKGKSKGKR
jgi:endonuclease YncB( thermonuclease family)